MKDWNVWKNRIETKTMQTEDYWRLSREMSEYLGETIDGSGCCRCREILKAKLNDIINGTRK